jgi:iron-only hydrogenase group A
MTKTITLKINGKKVKCNVGDSILYAAYKNKIYIPYLCFHPDFCVKGNCRVCVVEIKGKKELFTACSTKAEEGMEIYTETEEIENIRNTNIELIFAEHIFKCSSCIWRFECPLLKLAKKYKLDTTRFKERKKFRTRYKFANSVEIDGTQCIDCRNCIDACAMQKINYLKLRGKGIYQEVVPTKDKEKHCILCGQCALHCPVSSAQEQEQTRKVEKILKEKDKIVIAQFAPSIRVSIGEDFNMPYGEIVTEQIVSGLRKLGFKYVFDINFGADITTLVEAEELVERLKQNKKLPMFTSCCPGWVNYVEHYYPKLIPHLTTARSPHMHSGGIIKTYFANLMNIDPKKIIVVSIVPCTAKKYEAIREEMKIKGMFPVDYVLTTREFSFLLKKHKLDLSKLNKSKADSLLGNYSGAAAIYGASGGVMESALRSAQYFACPEKCKLDIDFKSVRGLEGVKEANVVIAGKKLRVAVVNGIGNIKSVLRNMNNYDYIEVMACPGGCIGGGGQPIPTTNEIRKKRIEALYKLDKSLDKRKAHENKEAVKSITWLNNKNIGHEVLHTSYKPKTKY